MSMLSVMKYYVGDSTPLGMAHAALEDGIYGEYFILKGSIIIGDSWCVSILGLLFETDPLKPGKFCVTQSMVLTRKISILKDFSNPVLIRQLSNLGSEEG